MKTVWAFIGFLILCAFMVGCNSSPRYELVAGNAHGGHMVFRLDQKTGEVCAFRYWRNTESGEATGEGFKHIECANKPIVAASYDEKGNRIK